ncbi:hypothetical protein [Alteromonas sp. ASW11-130]|uniref:hypothetical protein n=1 Tax=Alteromonas sp. ASW11-130 TaxID=3015775 RepID=UPI0022427EA0|nr:hypothetical protein [Alteromonas sp. ASW11-130]MCW8093401.1 hypothetical protein [Alteromonas sp. ASW11-130]
MSSLIHIYTVYSSEKTAVKRYNQKTSGTAYYKVSGQVLEMIESGIQSITIIYEGDAKWSKFYRRQVERLQRLFPDIAISYVEEF